MFHGYGLLIYRLGAAINGVVAASSSSTVSNKNN